MATAPHPSDAIFQCGENTCRENVEEQVSHPEKVRVLRGGREKARGAGWMRVGGWGVVSIPFVSAFNLTVLRPISFPYFLALFFCRRERTRFDLASGPGHRAGITNSNHVTRSYAPVFIADRTLIYSSKQFRTASGGGGGGRM